MLLGTGAVEEGLVEGTVVVEEDLVDQAAAVKGMVCDLDESVVVNIGVEVAMEPGRAVAVLEGIH